MIFLIAKALWQARYLKMEHIISRRNYVKLKYIFSSVFKCYENILNSIVSLFVFWLKSTRNYIGKIRT